MRWGRSFVAWMLAALFFLPPLTAQDRSLGENIAAVNKQGGKPDPQTILGGLRFDSRDNLDESRRSLQNALAFDPGNPDYHFELSRVYGALYDETNHGRGPADARYLDLSQGELEQVLMIRPNDLPAHYNLGVIYKRRKRMERSRDEFQRVLKLAKKEGSASPVSISTWMQISATYEDQGFFEEAHDAYMKARELGGNRPEIQSAIDDLIARQHEDALNQREAYRADSWNHEYISGAEYAQFGSDAAKAQSRSAGVGSLLPIVGQLLFQQFMERRTAKKNQDPW